jgi:hypothetical protein
MSVEQVIRAAMKQVLSGKPRNDLWGRHRIVSGSSAVIAEVHRPVTGEDQTSITVFHEHLGKWVCVTKFNKVGGIDLDGKPMLILTVERIREYLEREPTRMPELYELYSVPAR